MVSTPTGNADVEERSTAGSSLPEFVDWIIGALIALGGLIFVGGGSALVYFVDRDLLAEGVEDGTITVTIGFTELTDAETVAVTDAVVSWTGPGLLVTGIGMVLFGIGYVFVRHRAHRQAGTGESVSSYSTFALLGAFATTVFSFLPISPVVGGALAGYLERGESDRTVSVGALAGLLPMLPMMVAGLFVFGGMVTGMLAIDQVGNAVFAGATLFFSVIVAAAIVAGLGALGGYLGGKFAESRASAD